MRRRHAPPHRSTPQGPSPLVRPAPWPPHHRRRRAPPRPGDGARDWRARRDVRARCGIRRAARRADRARGEHRQRRHLASSCAAAAATSTASEVGLRAATELRRRRAAERRRVVAVDENAGASPCHAEHQREGHDRVDAEIERCQHEQQHAGDTDRDRYAYTLDGGLHGDAVFRRDHLVRRGDRRPCRPVESEMSAMPSRANDVQQRQRRHTRTDRRDEHRRR